MLGEWKLPRVQETLFCKTTFFKMDPSSRKLQESGNKQNKIKEHQQNSQIMYTSTYSNKLEMIPAVIYF